MRPTAALQFTALDTTPKLAGGTDVSFSPVMIDVEPDGSVRALGTTADGDTISLSGISFHP